MSVIGYKATYDYKCRDKEYKVGKTYKMSKSPVICQRGFHYCLNASSVLNYYSYNDKFKLLQIEDLSSRTDRDSDKSATDKIKFVREITDPEELYNLLGTYKKFDKKGNEVYSKERGYNCTAYTEKHFDSKYRLKTKRIVEANGSWVESTFNTQRQITKVEKSCGYIQTKKYDKKGRLVEEKCTDGTFAYIEYDANGKISSRRASFGDQIKTTVSRNGSKTRIVKVDGVISHKTVTNSKGLQTLDKTIGLDYTSVEVTTYHSNDTIKRIVSKHFNADGKLYDFNDQIFDNKGNLLKEKTLKFELENFYKKGRLFKTVETTFHN